MTFLVHCNRPSKSARALAKALKGSKIKTPIQHTNGIVIINWGDSGCDGRLIDLNKPEAVGLAANKSRAFHAFASQGVLTPNFATTKKDVDWQGVTVVRHKLTGHSGEGIEIIEEGQELPDAPLYVQYVKKEQEFRIHVGRRDEETKIIAVQRKARDRSVPDEHIDWKIRNHNNGFIFVRGDANPHQLVFEAATNALRSLGLDFGAVDIIWNAKEGKAYVLEINTAPGLEGQTINDYANFFRG